MPTMTCPRPSPSVAGARIPQRRPHPGRTPRPFHYDPAVRSLGMTLDSPRGPVDLVAVERVLCGIPAALTVADLGYLYAHLHQATAPLDAVAAALGVRFESVKRQAERAKSTRDDAAAVTR